jgi:glycolate oxidase iron-sulfur subunit
LQHAQGIRTAPRQLLSAIPELEVVEVADAALCCGSAGIYNLVEPTPANELGDRKARQILDTGADVIASGNPGCLLHLQASLRRLGRELPALHTIELIDASIRGVMPIPQPRKESEAQATQAA